MDVSDRSTKSAATIEQAVASDAAVPGVGENGEVPHLPVAERAARGKAERAEVARGCSGGRRHKGSSADLASRRSSQMVIEPDPSTGIRMLVDAQRRAAYEPERISIDTEFALEGGEEPTPCEVLLHAAMTGGSKRFTRQDGVEQCSRSMGPLFESHPRCTRTRRDRGVSRPQRRSFPVIDVGINPGW
jgi:hypothetical protein